jgi:hypothetical protein
VSGMVCFCAYRNESREFAMLGQVPKWTKGADCKSVAIGFQGSNPCLPTSGKAQVEVKAEAIERALPLNLNLDLNLF